MWYEGPDRIKWIIFMAIVTVIGIIVCSKGIKMIDRYFEEEEKKQKLELMQRAMELHKKYGGSISRWIEAVEIFDDEISAREYLIRKYGGMKG